MKLIESRRKGYKNITVNNFKLVMNKWPEVLNRFKKTVSLCEIRINKWQKLQLT